MLSIIVAIAKNHAIGRNNKLLWHLSEDLKYFKRTTSGHTVIMGYNTFLSVGGRAFPNRRNIIVNKDAKDEIVEGVEIFSSLEKAIEAVKGEEEAFIIGGGMLYRTSMPYTDKLYITEVDVVIEDADTFFPVIDLDVWKEESRSQTIHDEKEGYNFNFVTYIKK